MRIKKHGIPKVVEKDPDLPFITVSPQCPENSWWANDELDSLIALLDDVAGRYAVDATRIYLTGMSMGGYGAWHLALRQPDRFAAIAPVCGGICGPAGRVCALKTVPVWVFHGAQDPTVPIAESERLVAALQGCGGDVRFTAYPDSGHDSWTETYDNPDLYAWFLEHTR